MEPDRPPQETSQRACDVLTGHLESQGFLVAQDLLGDDQRVIFVGRRIAGCVVAEIRSGVTTVDIDDARSILASLEPMAQKHKATERVVTFADPVQLGGDARQAFEHAGVQPLAVDLDDNEIVAL